MHEEVLDTLRDISGVAPTESLIRLPIIRALQQFCEKRTYQQAYVDEFNKLPAFLKYRITKTNEQTSTDSV